MLFCIYVCIMFLKTEKKDFFCIRLYVFFAIVPLVCYYFAIYQEWILIDSPYLRGGLI